MSSLKLSFGMGVLLLFLIGLAAVWPDNGARGWAGVHLVWVSGSWRVHPLLLVIAGVGIGALSVTLIATYHHRRFLEKLDKSLDPNDPDGLWEDRRAAMVETIGPAALGMVIGTLCLLALGAVAANVHPISAMLIVVLGAASLLTLVDALGLLRAGDTFQFDSHWGGLGGGLGGWRLSPAALSVVLLVILIGSLTSIGLIAAQGPAGSTPDNASQASNAVRPDKPRSAVANSSAAK